ncbi:hypothetical protein J1N35_032167 [Gossypium stocksii]|uniref:Uncharacterized protein n=1 Tax=Gossypium stocksii TaxID=47602 RepID=A0A9D3ZW04_9ROSI|nr:hypothetical protein J1N35_032167 [Gossypium stocksii]
MHVPPPVDTAAGTVHFKNPEEMLPEGFLERSQERGMLNAYMMKELGLAVVMRLDYRKGISDVVMADEIEEGVRQVMGAGSEVRKKVKKTEEIGRLL